MKLTKPFSDLESLCQFHMPKANEFLYVVFVMWISFQLLSPGKEEGCRLLRVSYTAMQQINAGEQNSSTESQFQSLYLLENLALCILWLFGT